MNLADHVQGEGQTWVFLHGWGMNQGIWKPVTDALQPYHRVITLDLPGFGSSPWRSDCKEFMKSLEAIEQHLLTRVSGPCYLVGWSMGGLFAQAIAARQHLTVKGLVLVASTPKFTESSTWPGIQGRVLAVFQQQLKRDFSATIARFLAVQAMGSPQTREDIRTIQALLAHYPEPHPEALAAGLDWLEREDLSATFATLNCPTLRIYGRRDSLVPVKQAERLSKEQDHYVVYEHSAHTPFLNELPRFIDDLQKFQSQLESD